MRRNVFSQLAVPFVTAISTLTWFSFLLSFVFLAGACSDDDGSKTETFSVTGLSYSGITSSTVTLSATLSGATSSITKKGFCYGTEPGVDIASATVEVKGSGSAMSTELTGLSANKTYYVKAFANGASGAVYSSELSFTTLDGTVDQRLAQYVAPAYDDNYTGISSWSKRDQWNLANVHDPTVMKADDGYYYMYQTNASYGNVHVGNGLFLARRSRDLVNWEFIGAALPSVPAWVKTKLNEMRVAQGLDPIESPSYAYWAPVARRVSAGKYRLYYCVVINNSIQTGVAKGNFDGSWSERAFIGLAETADPAGNVWEDKGYVVCSSTDRGLDWSRSSQSDWSGYFKWNAIDPTYTITPAGEHWLIYGSWHSGMVALQLDGATGKPLKALGDPWDIDALPDYGRMVATRTIGNRWQGSEAPEVVYNPATDYYYMFLAYDAVSVSYNTRVVRSRSITGPYLGINGTDVTEGGNAFPVVTHPYKFNDSYGWVGISHCAVFDDGDGNWYYASQGRLPENISGINASNAVMLGHIRSIRWTADGWPLVMPERYGAVPKVEIKESELIGNWEHIDLAYSYGKQKESTTMTLGADHKITAGAWKGAAWSYDKTRQVLTANGVDLYLQRETDWEATPRTHTIVYAGYTTSTTYWGKKIK